MHRVRLLCKRLAWAVLPQSAVQFVKRRHYLRLVRAWSAENEPDVQIVRHLVRDGDHVVDIGANVGVYTKVLSHLVGAGGRVYSIEPFPPTFDILCFVVARLGIGNAAPVNVAISDCESIVTMELPYDASGAETHYRARVVVDGASSSKAKTVRVSSTTIDSLFSKEADKISFIKCDAEGHELACLRGAAGFLARAQPAWMIEVSGDPDERDSPAYRLFELFSQRNYTAWWFDGTALRMRRSGDRSVNYFFLADRHISTLRSRAPELVQP